MATFIVGFAVGILTISVLGFIIYYEYLKRHSDE